MTNSEEMPIRFSSHTLDKATKAKLTLENYYSNLISQHRERQERLRRLEESLSDKVMIVIIMMMMMIMMMTRAGVSGRVGDVRSSNKR